jgi:putative addiction module component (TIGR02574 family)
MAATMKDLGIDEFSPAERAALALEIRESLEDDLPAIHLSPAQRTELLARDAELDTNPGMAITWEQIRSGVEGNP